MGLLNRGEGGSRIFLSSDGSQVFVIIRDTSLSPEYSKLYRFNRSGKLLESRETALIKEEEYGYITPEILLARPPKQASLKIRQEGGEIFLFDSLGKPIWTRDFGENVVSSVVSANDTSLAIFAEPRERDYELFFFDIKNLPPAPLKEFILSYQEYCSGCGAEFIVKKAQWLDSLFRIELTIKNTGELGRLKVRESAYIYFLDEEGISQLTNLFQQQGFETAVAQLTPGFFTNLSKESGYFQPVEGKYPDLEVGQTWSGWWEVITPEPLPPTIEGVILWFEKIDTERIGPYRNYTSWISIQPGQLYISLR